METNIKSEYWLKCWIGVASSSNVTDPKRCGEWADRMLKDFANRFPDANPKVDEKKEGDK